MTPPYQQFSYGGALRAGYQITENLRQTLKYTARSDDITNVQSNASLFIALQAGSTSTSEIGQVLLYDRRDNRLDPTGGYFASAGQRLRRCRLWRPLCPQQGQRRLLLLGRAGWVLSFTGEAGDIFGWGGQQVLLQDRFFVGGDNLRGFQQRRDRSARLGDRRCARRQQVLCRLGDAWRAAGPAEGTRPHRARLHRFRHAVVNCSRRISC